MSRTKKDHEENVVPLNLESQAAMPQPAPANKDRKGGPTDIDCKAYDRLIREVHHLQELTGCEGWKQYFGSLLREADEARSQLEFAEKPRDVVKLQATIALVKSQLKKLHQPVEDLNGMRTRWPLFTDEMPWRGDFDELTGRVTVIWAGRGTAPERLDVIFELGESEPAPEGERHASPASGPGPDEDDEDEDLDTTGPGPEPDDPFGN